MLYPKIETLINNSYRVHVINSLRETHWRAFEKSTGKLVWETDLPAMANATACTYEAKGKQFIALSVGGTPENPSGFIMAFSLP